MLGGLNLYAYCENDPINQINASRYRLGTSNASGINGIGESNIGGNSRNLPALPGWIDPLQGSIDIFSSLAPILRTAGTLFKDSSILDLMRLDGITELPGGLSTFGKIAGWSLIGIDAVLTGYSAYQSGASLGASVTAGAVRGAIGIGTMLAGAKMGALLGASIGSIIPGAGTAVGAIIGAVLGIGISLLLTYNLTKVEIGGKTIEKHIVDFINKLFGW